MNYEHFIFHFSVFGWVANNGPTTDQQRIVPNCATFGDNRLDWDRLTADKTHLDTAMALALIRGTVAAIEMGVASTRVLVREYGYYTCTYRSRLA